MLSVNIIICYYPPHSWRLKQTQTKELGYKGEAHISKFFAQTQTLRVNKELQFHSHKRPTCTKPGFTMLIHVAQQVFGTLWFRWDIFRFQAIFGYMFITNTIKSHDHGIIIVYFSLQCNFSSKQSAFIFSWQIFKHFLPMRHRHVSVNEPSAIKCFRKTAVIIKIVPNYYIFLLIFD